MNYDDILEELGELGPWQILHLLLLWLPVCASGVWTLTYSITGKIFYCTYFCFIEKPYKTVFYIHCKYLNARSECNDIVISVYSHYPLDPNAKSSDTKCVTLSIR